MHEVGGTSKDVQYLYTPLWRMWRRDGVPWRWAGNLDGEGWGQIRGERAPDKEKGLHATRLAFFKAWRSPTESIAPKRPNHRHSEPNFTKDSNLFAQNPTPRVLNTLH